MVTIDLKFISELLGRAAANPRLRQNYDLRTSPDEECQRMLNALLPGTEVPVHRHPHSDESVLLICGKMVEVICDGEGNVVERCCLDASSGNFGCIVPAGVWHTVEVLEPSVIMEVKAGRYGEDGSGMLEPEPRTGRQTDAAGTGGNESVGSMAEHEADVESGSGGEVALA